MDGCTPEESCLARNGCPAGDDGVTVNPLPLTPRSATYYLDYGSVLAAFSPQKPSYCEPAVRVLTQLIQTYHDDQVIVRNAEDGLSICAMCWPCTTSTPTPVIHARLARPARIQYTAAAKGSLADLPWGNIRDC